VGNCTTGRYTGEPIGMNFKDLDLKDFFRVIHEISGLNVVLDPAVKGSVTIVLDDVPWDQALAIVLHNNGLECQLQGNVLRIATLETMKTEADQLRARQEAQALAVPREQITRYLSYGQAKDAVSIVKRFLSQRGDVVADQRSNALIIEDIPSYLAKIDPLLKTLDRKTPEVEIEARVVASTRTFARDIGTQLGYGFGQGHSAVGGATANSPIKVGFPPGVVPRFITGANDITSIPLFSDLGSTAPNSGIEFTTATPGFRLDFILTMAESRGLLKVLSRPSITTQNNIKALIRQGTRVPVVTAAQLGGPPTVQYIDAFLRLTVTPQITAENTIFLEIDVENTVADTTSITGSQVNPTLDTQQATTSVLVADGGTVVIGGVVQTQNNIAIAQVPLLGSIPILGNLFKHQNVKTSTQELIFFITPKIIQT
jgi:type IV pilus assembly protein PilQ